MTVFSSDSGSSDYCASSVTRHQPAMVRLQNIATRKPVDYKSEEAKSAGFCCAQVQAMLGQARLLESSYTFNASIIAQIDAHLQQRVLPQLQARVVSTMQRLRLQDAAQQAQLINQAAADVMAVCTPELQRDMHVVTPLQLDCVVAQPAAFSCKIDEAEVMSMPEDARHQWRQYHCLTAHNNALRRARQLQSCCINGLLACACGPELTRRLAQQQLQRRGTVEQYAADAVLEQL